MFSVFANAPRTSPSRLPWSESSGDPMSGTLSSVTADPILSGIWATPLLPLDENDQLRRDALVRQVERLAASPVDGVYTNGTAAEFDLQTEEEFDFLSDRVALAC